MHMNNKHSFFTAYGTKLAKKLNDDIDFELLERFQDTNIGAISDGVFCYEDPYPESAYVDNDGIEHFVLDSGTHICMDLLVDHFDSLLNRARLNILAGLEEYFFQIKEIGLVITSLNQEAEEGAHPDFSISQSITALPYDTTMMYFSCKYIEHEGNAMLYAQIIDEVEELLEDHGLESGILLEGLNAEQIGDLLDGWKTLDNAITANIKSGIGLLTSATTHGLN